MTRQEIKEQVNWKAIIWVGFCVVLGTIGFFTIKNPNIHQPLYAWIFGALFLESIVLVLSLILSSFMTAIFVKDFDDMIKVNALGKDNNSDFGKLVNIIFIAFFIIITNISFGISMCNNWY